MDPYHAKARTADSLDVTEPYDPPMVYMSLVRDSESVGLEPFATAAASAMLSSGQKWLHDKSLASLFSCVWVVPYYDRAGRLQQAEQAIAAAIDSLTEMKFIDGDAHQYLIDFAHHLTETGRHENAEFVFQKLLTTSKCSGQQARLEVVKKEYCKFQELRRTAADETQQGSLREPNSPLRVYATIFSAATALANRLDAGTAIDDLINELRVRGQFWKDELKKDIYEDHANKRNFRILWNCLTHFAHVLVDQKRFTEADLLGRRIIECFEEFQESDAALIPILVDRAIHAEQFKLSEEYEWKKIEAILASEPDFRRVTNTHSATMFELNMPYLLSFKLRQFAMMYSLIDSHARAMALINRACRWINQKLSALDTEIHEKHSDEHHQANFLVRADLAICAIKSSNFILATKALDEVCAMQDISSLYGIANKLFQIADAYTEVGKVYEARSFIERVRNLQPVLIRPRHFQEGNYHWQLAKLLANQNDTRAAYQTATKAYEMIAAHTVPSGLGLLCAELALSCGDHVSAARHYLRVQNVIEGSTESERRNRTFKAVEPFYTDIERQLLHNALAANESKESLSKEEKSEILLRLAKCYQCADHEIARSILGNALQLVPGNTKLASQIWLAQANLNRQEENFEQSLKQEEWAAALAEQADKATSHKNWLLLAEHELSAKLKEQAVKHIEHALECYAKYAKKDAGNFRPLLVVDRDIIIPAFCKDNEFKIAEGFLRKQINAIASVYGKESQQEAWGYAELAYLFTKQKRYADIDKLIKPILVMLVGHGHDFSSIMKRLQEIGQSFYDDDQVELATGLLTSVVTLQKRVGRGREFSLELAISTLQKIYCSKGEYAAAAAVMRDGLLMRRAGHINFMPLYFDDYKAVLEKLGESMEDDYELMNYLTEGGPNR